MIALDIFEIMFVPFEYIFVPITNYIYISCSYGVHSQAYIV